jgi:valyl-tRNA synthetase
MRTEVSSVCLTVPPDTADDVRTALADVRAAGRVTGDLDLVTGDVSTAVADDAVLVMS